MKPGVARVKKYFPQVTRAKDAKDSINIEVTSLDARNSMRKKHAGCALAVACKRTMDLDGAIVSVATAYLIKGNTAIRFSLAPGTSREIVSFDRGAGFAPGVYKLSKPGHPIGHAGGKKKTKTGKSKNRITVHRTENIRATLGANSVAR